MANGFTIGAARGLESGLQAGSRISGRIEESRQDKRQGERQTRLDRRRELAQNLSASDAYLNNPRIGDEAKKDYYNNIYIPIMEEFLGEGVEVPTITAWTPGLGKYVKQSVGIVEDVGKGKLSRKQGKLAFAAMPDEARNDPTIKAITEDFYEEGRLRKTDRFEADKVFMRSQPGRTGPPTPEESQRFNRILKTPGYKEELGNAIMAESGKEVAGGGLTPTVRTQIRGETEPPVARALERIQQGRIDVAKAGVIAKAEAESDLPIPTNELIKFVDERGHFPPANLTPNQAEELGFFPITEQMSKQVLAAGNVGAIIEEMDPIVDRLFRAEGFWDRVTGAFPNAKAYLLQEGDEQLVIDATFYQAMKQGVAGQFAKVVSGEGGRLTDQDIQRVLRLFPTFFNSVGLADTKAVAKRKIKFLKKRLEDERKRILKRDGIPTQGSLIRKDTTKAGLIDIGNRNLSEMSLEELQGLK